MREEFRSGLGYLEALTALLQRIRNSHPTAGMYQPAEVQFWWGRPRSTDAVDQLFWFDDDGRPEAAVAVVDFSDAASILYSDPTLVVTVMPGAAADWVAHVVDRGLAHIGELGIESVELEIDRDDDVMRELFTGRGFTNKAEAVVECWLDADARPEVSPLHDGYRLVRRSDISDRPHYMNRADGPDVEERLRQTSLYRADLDLVVLDGEDNHAAHGIFWNDPVTGTGVVEPMRTHGDHQQRGLARHILTAGVDLLAQAGAGRISIGYEPDNPASGHLYRSVGFEPHARTDLYAR